MTCGDDGIVPQGRKSLVALRSLPVVGLGEPEAVSAPDGDDLGTILGRHELPAHVLDVFGLGRGPYNDGECADAIGEERSRIRAFDKASGIVGAGSVEEGAVQVNDDQQVARVGEKERRMRRDGEIFWRGIGDAARLGRRRVDDISRAPSG